MFSERRKERADKAGQPVYEWHRVGKRANHIWDCECMQVTAAMMARCLETFFTIVEKGQQR